MSGVITGFAVIAVVIGTGYMLGRYRLLGDNGREVLTKLAFHVATPALMFETLAARRPVAARLRALGDHRAVHLRHGRPVRRGGALRRWPRGRRTVGALCASYVNAGNLGIPVAAYVLGDASLVAPVLLFQLLLMTPDRADRARRLGLQRRRQRAAPHHHPVPQPDGARLARGVAVAATRPTLPDPVLEPFHAGRRDVGSGGAARVRHVPVRQRRCRGAARPAAGPALRGVQGRGPAADRVAPGHGPCSGCTGRRPVRRGGDLGPALGARTSSPTPARYGVATRLARESILLSTILSVPVLFVIAALLG